MNKFSLLLLLCVFLSSNLKAQTTIIQTTEKYPEKVIRVHVTNPGIMLEKQIVDNKTFIFDVGVSFLSGAYFDGSSLDLYFDLIPNIRIEPRIYTSFKKRVILQRRTDYYSSQFFAFQLRGGYYVLNELPILTAGPIWGFQRTLGDKGYWSISLGMGWNQLGDVGMIGLLGDLEFGFILN